MLHLLNLKIKLNIINIELDEYYKLFINNRQLADSSKRLYTNLHQKIIPCELTLPFNELHIIKTLFFYLQKP